MVSMAYSKSWWKWILMLLLLLVNLGFECSALGGNVLAEGPDGQQVFPDKVEIDALFSLRSSLGLRSKEWPKKVNPCTSWVGIICDSGHVVAINLTGFRRTVVGSRNPKFAVDGLQNLTYLQNFTAPGFALPGSIPPLFGQLTALKVLNLSSASINGEIPPSLGNASNLSVLVLSGNNLTGNIPSSLEKLAGLSILDLSFNKLYGLVPPEFSNLKNLTSLNLSVNNINGSIPSELGNLSLLNELDLGSNALSGIIPKELGNLRGLNNLVLANNKLSGSIPEEIFNCTALQTLRLDQNNLTDALPSSISKLVNIAKLNISNNLFYKPLPAGLTSLPNLLVVDLSYNFFENKTVNVSPPRMFVDDQNCLQEAENQRSFRECNSFYAGRGLSFSGFGETNSSAPPPMGVGQSGGKNKHLAPILGGVFGGLGFVLLVILLVLLYLKYERKVDHRDRNITPPVRRGGQSSVGISVNLSQLGESFAYEQLSQATEDFSASNLLKNGHSGDLYQGLLEGGVPIVVKRINLNTFKKDGYLAELDILGRASHTRLVPLLGHCLEREDEKLLVYKYMPYRDLSYALYKKASSPEDTLQSLDWITRLKIAIGAAEGLSFLHHECSPPVVHRDVQASSILLDDKFEVRLGSLTEACPQEGEPHQSVIARILRLSQTSEQGMSGTPVATCAYDVYCFGKVLMELVSGKLGISGSSDPSAFTWLEGALPLINIYEKESVTKIVDPSLIVDEDLLEEVWAMAIVAKSCLNPKPSKRPLMRYILKALENPLKVVREDNANASARLRTSSHGSWNAALFGSWRHSSSEIVAVPGPLREEYSQKGPLKEGGTAGSQGSGGQGGDVSSHKRLSNEIFPEPMEEAMVQASSTDIEKQED